MRNYHAYIDESGTHLTAAHLAVALALVPEPRVNEFAVEWHNLLSKRGVREFHMTDFNAGKREFNNWSKQQSHEFSLEVIDVVKRYVVFWFGCVIETAHRKLIEDEKMLLSPYLVGSSFLLQFISDWANAQSDDVGIAYTLEAGYIDEPRFNSTLKRIVAPSPENRDRYRYLSHQFDSKANPGIQVADIFAWQLYVDSRRFDASQARRGDFKSLLQIPHVVGHFDEDALRLVRAGCTDD